MDNELKLGDINSRKLPAKIQKLIWDEMRQRINQARGKRMELAKEMEKVSKDRADYIAKERSAGAGKADSFDEIGAQVIRKGPRQKGISC